MRPSQAENTPEPPMPRRFPPYPAKAHRSGRARITVARKDVYLNGPFDSQQSHDHYLQLRRRWLSTGRVDAGKAVTAASLTVAQLVAEFNAYDQAHSAKDTARIRGYYTGQLAGAFPGTIAADLRVYDVQKWADGMRAAGRWGEVAYCNGLRSAFRVFSWAEESGLLKPNPLARLKRPSPGRRRRRGLTDAEYRAMLRRSRPAFRRYLVALWWTGARPKELRTATWEQWKGNRIVQEEHKTRRTRKDGAPRVIWLPRPVQFLVAWLRKQGNNIPTKPIFLNTRGQPWTTGAICQQVAELRERCRLPRDVTSYLTRHGVITRALVNGVPVATAAELYGNSPAVIDSTYSHLDDEQQHLAAAAEQAARRPPRAG